MTGGGSSDFDVVVVGSGFGGAVAACRLSVAGYRVLVLERGRRWAISEYPRRLGDAWLYDVDNPHRRNGWFDMRLLDRRMAVITAAGVGGGSLAYANVSIDAAPHAFRSGWPSAVTYDELVPYYERVAEMLRPNVIPDGQHPPRLELMREAAAAVGASERFRKLELAITFDPDGGPVGRHGLHNSKPHRNPFGRMQGTCTHTGHCVIGCKARAKNTLDLNYLAVAEDAGAEIRPLSQVRYVSRGDGWVVHYRDVSGESSELQRFRTRRVILAAGSLGSTEILLRSKDQYRSLPDLPGALGHGWSANGDFVTLSRHRGRRVAPTLGPTITSAIDYSDDPRAAGVFVEDGGSWNWLDLLADGQRNVDSGLAFLRRPTDLIRRALDFDSVMPWFAQAMDAHDGRLHLRGRGASRPLKLTWNPRRSAAMIDRIAVEHRRLAYSTAGRPLTQAHWSRFRTLVTPHPLGGCAMSASSATGVVDDCGCVFGHPGLYVMDGSIVPGALGLNPSKTIAALAERAVDHLRKEPTKRNR